MLALTRKCGEFIDVTFPDGTRVEIAPVRMKGRDEVMIGLNAPCDVVIERREIRLARLRAEAAERAEREREQRQSVT